MSINKQIYDISRETRKLFINDTNFQELEVFYKNALESGLAKKSEYTLPPIDTIGHSFNIKHDFNDVKD